MYRLCTLLCTVLCSLLGRWWWKGLCTFGDLVIVIALRISTVSKRGDIEDKTLEFSPTFTHQVFGDR